MASDVFISYRSTDLAHALSVKAALERSGISCWMAPDSIPGGSNYAKAIPGGIKQAQIFVLIMTSSTQGSIWVPRELDIAVNAQKMIIPFMLEDVELTDEYNFYLIGSQYVRAYLGLEEKLQELTQRIQSILEKNPTPEHREPPREEPRPRQDNRVRDPIPKAAPETSKVPASQVVERFLEKKRLSEGSLFHCSSPEAIRKNFNIPADVRMFLAHDDSWFGRSKNGFAFCSDGLYVVEVFGDRSFLSWKDFAQAAPTPPDPEQSWKVQYTLPNGRSVSAAYITGTQDRETVRALLQELHLYLSGRNDVDYSD